MATDEEEFVWRSRRPTRETAKQREAVRLREIEGLSFQEIAERLGYRHRGSAKKAYDAGVKAGDVDLTDSEHRQLLVRRYERMYSIAAKQAEKDQDITALRAAGVFLDKIARIKALDVAPTRGYSPTASRDDDEDRDGTVIGPNRLELLRARRRGATDAG